MPNIQKSIDIKSMQKSSLLHNFSDFIEVYDYSDGFTTQSLSEYILYDFGANFSFPM